MKYVNEIYPFDINSTIGPTGTIKRLFRNRVFFEKQGYNMTLFALQRDESPNHTHKLELSEIIVLPEDKHSIVNATAPKTGWRTLLQSRKHELVESNYLTSSLAYHRANRHNLEHIKKYIKQNRKVDIVVFHDMRSCYNFLLYRNDTHAKTVLFLHNDGSDTDMFCKRHPKLAGTREERILIDELKYTYEHCDCIVWISRLAKERFCRKHPEYAHKARVVVNGINDIQVKAQVPSTTHKYRMVSTGTVCERKGQYMIIEAMHHMRPELLAETHLSIIGSGPDYGKLVNLTDKYGLNNNVTLMGNVANKDVPLLLKKENIFILMSNNEGLPISILEAMRAGLPVISTNIAGIPEEVDQRNGILINPDVTELVEILNKLPNYNWETLGESSRERFEKEFTFDIMRQEYVNMFKSLFVHNE